MTTRRAAVTLGWQLAVIGTSCRLLGTAQAQTEADSTPPRLRSLLQSPRLIGQQRLTYWGFEVYDASLWANTRFAPETWATQTLVLELRYLRDFKGADIAKRSMDEMQGQKPLSATQQHTWSAMLQNLIPNVRVGDTLTGVYQPNKGMQLLHQDRLLGDLRDAELAQRFFGIWLAPETSQRQLRQQLLAGAQP